MPDSSESEAPVLKEVLPKTGLVFSEKSALNEVLCKPKIIPIKSLALEKLERLQKAANEAPRDEEKQS